MTAGLVIVSYIGATILFILALGGLSNQETARRGNMFGIAGMAIALVATILGVVTANYAVLIGAFVIGAAIGLVAARRVQMTQMPELVAILHSLVGLAAVLVGYANFLDPAVQLEGAEQSIHNVETYLGILIGAVTLSGSVIAFGKLSGSIGGKPLTLPARHWLNLGLLIAVLVLRLAIRDAGTGSRADAAAHHDDGRAAVRRAPRDGDWRRGHAGRRLDAQQLLGMGGVGHRIHAQQRPVDRDRRAGRQQRRDSELHHVPRHEPQVPVGHRRRLRQRRRRARPGRQRGTARRGHIDRRG